MADRHRRVRPGRVHVFPLLVVASIGASAWQRRNDPAGDKMTYVVDPAWPRPLPAPKNAAGQTQQWVTGDVSGSCIDARDHLFVVTRGFQRGGITTTDGTQSIASPPVLEFDATGTVVNSWGDRIDRVGRQRRHAQCDSWLLRRFRQQRLDRWQRRWRPAEVVA